MEMQKCENSLPLQGAGGLLYDVPYLVREPNDSYMSLVRHKIEVQNQAIVDDYFITRDKGASAQKAKKKK